MPNMSYCRFQNTSDDLAECLDALEGQKPLSGEEYYAALDLFKSVLQFCTEEGFIEGYDLDRIREYLEKLRAKGD